MNSLSEHHILIFLLQVFLLLGSARLLGEMFRRVGQPSITAEILVGVVFGPTVFGRVAPGLFSRVFPVNVFQYTMLETVAWIGILLFLLKAGLEMDFSSAWRQRGSAVIISISDVIIPLVIAFIPAFFLPGDYMGNPEQRLIFSLFIATIMTISALPVTARILGDLNVYKTDLGFLIMCALAINDVIGWVLFTVLLGFVTQSDPGFFRIVTVLFATVTFTLVCLSIGRRFCGVIIDKMRAAKMPEPGASLTFICLLGIVCGMVTMKIGIHALFGFFIAGIMAGEARQLSENTRNVIAQMVHAIFVPLFFASIGLRIDFLRHFDWFLFMFMMVVGIGARYAGAWLGVTWSRLQRANRSLISIAHTPGGEMQIVVGILALEYGLIKEPVFVAIICSAVMSSVLAGPWMKWALQRKKKLQASDYLARESICVALAGRTPREVIAELVQALASRLKGITADAVVEEVVKREQVISTAIEGGIALPHARIPGLEKPIIGFGRSFPGIEWNSPDGQRSQFIFLILTPAEDEEAQLQIISQIARRMSDKQIRNELLANQDACAILPLMRAG